MRATSFEGRKGIRALLALAVGLRQLAHALLVDRAFGIKYFIPIRDLKSVTIGFAPQQAAISRSLT
jgi:hypothetical protein